ncbi:DUF4337 domain-containing protein [Roseomonas sp. NAR14]|uniref:DUF4337 domain-containing protein n=1 Tax=Roseomonas acroporae TaxID=2937791 RepID=A0A9X2BU62_9PROT|nr:DUF4337 family protein [Roseomonas acroporae]MCK8785338.1 DUF4337 domain-containing protein [Roseomonas acroporae]
MSDHPAAEAAEKARENKRTALLIAALALALALAQVAGDDAKTEAQMRNVESANLWAFFQARTVRQTVLGAAADRAVLDAALAPGPEARRALEAQVATWRATIARWESEPETREGRRQLMERAREAETARDRAMHEDGRYDAASAAIQIGIVLASAAIITAAPALAWVGGALGLGGAALALLTHLGLA